MEDIDRLQYLVQLDEELLVGGVILPEWCSLIVRETDIAFVCGANLATILTAVSAIETYLRSESSARPLQLSSLIDHSALPDDLRADLHGLRKYRNRWVHVQSPWQDGSLLANRDTVYQELEEMARVAVKVLRQTIYSVQWS